MRCSACWDIERPVQMTSSFKKDYRGMSFFWTCPSCKHHVQSCRIEFPNPEHVKNYPDYEVTHV